MISDQVINQVAETLQDKFSFVTTGQLDRAVSDLLKKTEQRGANGKNCFSLSTMIRGLRAMRGEPIAPRTSEADVAYVKALSTGATPGS